MSENRHHLKTDCLFTVYMLCILTCKLTIAVLYIEKVLIQNFKNIRYHSIANLSYSYRLTIS